MFLSHSAVTEPVCIGILRVRFIILALCNKNVRTFFSWFNCESQFYIFLLLPLQLVLPAEAQWIIRVLSELEGTFRQPRSKKTVTRPVLLVGSIEVCPRIYLWFVYPNELIMNLFIFWIRSFSPSVRRDCGPATKSECSPSLVLQI